ncbi:hypothetical protein PR048_011030 [Dryococelus australis]|uniref:Uncharacterized protein n=1 Tax=Dryococelus australis TaxID=614101 RepID=A0ABQ9HKH7_9NEOP|nr:hypothetical protein PR048_011030 [Dryococelus australis]
MRLLIKDLGNNIIEAIILTGPAAGRLAHIPRIPIDPNGSAYSFFQVATVSDEGIICSHDKQVPGTNFHICGNRFEQGIRHWPLNEAWLYDVESNDSTPHAHFPLSLVFHVLAVSRGPEHQK